MIPESRRRVILNLGRQVNVSDRDGVGRVIEG